VPDTTLLQGFDAIVNSAVEVDVRRYLEEARKCFGADANNAAVVMAWCGVILYFRKVVEKFGFDFLAYQRWVIDIGQQTETHPEDALNNWKSRIIEKSWEGVSDRQLLEACARMKLDLPERVWGEFRIKRNAFAHPDMEFSTPEEALELVKSGREVFNRRAQTELLAEIADLFAYAKQTTDSTGVQQAAYCLNASDNDVLESAHRVLDAFTKEREASQEGLIALWEALWRRLDDGRKGSLWKHIEQELQDVLDDANPLRSPEEMARFIVWPDPGTEHEGRDRIAEMYVAWLEHRVSDNEFINADMGLARDLRQHLPEPWQERLQCALEEMIRR
jgi:hypothetical protein